jgi:serpin B
MAKVCTECGASLSHEALFCGNCGTKIGETPVNAFSQSSNEHDLSDRAEGNNVFAFNLYSVLKGSDDNLFFSPYSISSVGGMLCEGADGETLREILKVFGLPENSTKRKQQFRTLLHQLNNSSQLYTLHTGNALWAQQAYPFLPEYIEEIQQHYHGEARNVDFAGNVEQARHTINEWVAQQTAQKIKELFAPGTLIAARAIRRLAS